MNKPLVSIIVPCFKQAEFLPDALQSILKQVYSNWECIIVNDGSPDKTANIAYEWLSKDNRFKYIEQENRGVCNARNTAISIAKGKFILPLDADDKISEDYIHLAVEAFRKNPALKLVYCNVEKFGEEDGIWKLPAFSLSQLAYANMIFSSALYKKDDWKNVGGYDEKMRDGWEDWEFWISLLKNGGAVKRINKTCFYYRIRKNSRNWIIKGDRAKKLYNYISIKHADFFVEQLGSFFELRDHAKEIEKEHQMRLQSEKFAIDLFLKRFFGFTLFGKYKQ